MALKWSEANVREWRETQARRLNAAQRGAVPEKLLAGFLKQELARQPNIGPDEPISALERAKLRLSIRVGGLKLDYDK